MWDKQLTDIFKGQKPAVTTESDGAKRYELGGALHREDGPAYDIPGGDFIWAMYGKKHRIGGPALKHDDYTGWYQYGELHREDGPAEERGDGLKRWMQHNQLHRLDGPAVINPDGSEEWWVNGEHLLKEEVAAMKQKLQQDNAQKLRRQAEDMLAPFHGTTHAVVAPEKAAFKKHDRKSHAGFRI